MDEPTSAWDGALAAYQAGDASGAKGLFLQILESDANNVDVLHMLSMIAHSENNIALHEGYLARILSINPNHVRSLTALANLLREREQVPEAIGLLKRAINVAPRYAPAHNALGLCYSQSKEWSDALGCFQTAIALQPGAAPIYINLGLALQGLGNGKQAATSYRTAISLDPQNPEAYEALGRISAKEGRRAQALRYYEKALGFRPDSVQYMLLIAKLLEFYARTEEAVELVKRAMKLDPTSSEAQLEYSYLMQDLGNFEASQSAARKSIELQPVQGRAYLGLVSTSKTKQEDRPLLETMHQLIESEAAGPEEVPHLHLALGKAYGDLGEYEKAIAHVDEANTLFIEDNGGTSPFDRQGLEKFADEIMATLSPQFFENHNGYGSDSDLPVFIIGLPRSGTTLVEQILSCHSQISPGGELAFWADLDAEEGSANLALTRRRCKEIEGAYLQLLRSIGPNSRFVTDKRPDNFCFAGFMHLLFPKARFIHCRRELIDNALSLYLTPFRSHALFTYSREDIVFYIGQYQRLMKHWRTVIPANLILDVNYEEVVTNLESSARRIVEFLGVPWEDACLHPELNKRAVGTPSNWQTRQAVYKTSVDKWKHYEPWLGELQSLLQTP